MDEFCRLRRNEGYGACDDEASRLFLLLSEPNSVSACDACVILASSAFLLPAGPERKNTC